MNVDLKKALEGVQFYFPEAEINGNVVTVCYDELTSGHIANLGTILMTHQNFRPWVFRSGKGLKVVFFLTDGKGNYLTSGDADEHMDLKPDGFANAEESIAFADWLSTECDFLDPDQQIWTFRGEDYSARGLYKVFIEETTEQ